VEALLQAGAPIDTADSFGPLGLLGQWTSLNAALDSGSQAISTALLDADADANHADLIGPFGLIAVRAPLLKVLDEATSRCSAFCDNLVPPERVRNVSAAPPVPSAAADAADAATPPADADADADADASGAVAEPAEGKPARRRRRRASSPWAEAPAKPAGFVTWATQRLLAAGAAAGGPSFTSPTLARAALSPLFCAVQAQRERPAMVHALLAAGAPPEGGFSLLFDTYTRTPLQCALELCLGDGSAASAGEPSPADEGANVVSLATRATSLVRMRDEGACALVPVLAGRSLVARAAAAPAAEQQGSEGGGDSDGDSGEVSGSEGGGEGEGGAAAGREGDEPSAAVGSGGGSSGGGGEGGSSGGGDSNGAGGDVEQGLHDAAGGGASDSADGGSSSNSSDGASAVPWGDVCAGDPGCDARLDGWIAGNSSALAAP